MKKNIRITTNRWFISAKACGKMLLWICLLGGLGSCKKYLDKKPDQKMVIPTTMQDCLALLDNYIVMTSAYPSGEFASDNYYWTLTSWNAQLIQFRDGYIWKPDGDPLINAWQTTYQKILFTNQALETLQKITPLPDEQALWNQIKGTALFYRSFCLYQAAQLWGKPYDPSTAETDLCMPLRVTASVSEATVRSTVKETYDKIIKDLNEAALLLPATLPNSLINKSRPGQVAANALLARVYLSMRDYTNALNYADKCLQKYRTLMQYDKLNSASTAPIPKYNDEMIFLALGGPNLLASISKIDSNLIKSYDANDLRKSIFFRENGGLDVGTYQFKGSYDGGASQFCGLATNEIYLIRAESYARTNNAAAAMADLNTLMVKRWSGTYTNMTATDADDALMKILAERRKELVYRGLRWSDLRRLNKETRFAITLTRKLDVTTYTLPPNDLRYVHLIPLEVLRREPMPQNPR